MSAIEQIAAAFDPSPKPITIPEWGDLTLAFPPITQAARERAKGKCKDPTNADEMLLRLMIDIAKTEDGSKAFKGADYHALSEQTDFLVLQRVITHMFGGEDVFSTQGMADAEELIEADPTYASV